MGKPKSRTTSRRTNERRSGMVLRLKRRVNGILSRVGSPVKATTTKREGAGKQKSADTAKKAA